MEEENYERRQDRKGEKKDEGCVKGKKGTWGRKKVRNEKKEKGKEVEGRKRDELRWEGKRKERRDRICKEGRRRRDE